MGGGWGLVDFLFKSAERNGIPVRYNTGLRKLIQNRKGEITGITVHFSAKDAFVATARCARRVAMCVSARPGGATVGIDGRLPAMPPR